MLTKRNRTEAVAASLTTVSSTEHRASNGGNIAVTYAGPPVLLTISPVPRMFAITTRHSSSVLESLHSSIKCIYIHVIPHK